MAGLLGDGWGDPASMANLQLAGGLLSPGSFGQGLSAGLAGYQRSLANSQDLDIKKQGLEMSKLQFAAALRNQQLINSAIEQGLGQGGAQSPGPADPSAPPAAPPQTLPLAGGGWGAAPTGAPSAPQGGPSPGLMFGVPKNQALPDLVFNGGKGIGELNAKYNTPTSFRPGGYALAPNGQMIQLPQVPEGFQAVRGADGQFNIIPVTGGADAVAASSTAKASGPAGFKQTEVINPDNTKSMVFNKDIPSFSSAPGVAASIRSAGFSPQSTENILADSQKQGGTPISITAPATGRPVTLPGVQTGFAPGVVAGAESTAKNAADHMADSYKAVSGANNSAATVQARLDEIEKFSKGAILGGSTQWRDYANNLISIANEYNRSNGKPEITSVATDRKTAGDLLDKNAAQIALAIGTGTQGTDALRSLAAAANPNRGMTQPAIAEAVAQLKASAAAQQAKAQVLTPIFNSNDPKAYNTAEQQFDKNADFRVFQMANDTKGMNKEQVLAYFKSKGYTKSQVDDLMTKRSNLNQFGLGL